MSERLKPCPICVSDNVNFIADDEQLIEDTTTGFIWCHECGFLSDSFYSEKIALEKWNRRTPDIVRCCWPGPAPGKRGDMKKKITCCPYCGSTEGIYTLDTYKGVPYRRGFDGTSSDNCGMYDSANIDYGKLAYFQSCNKVICLSTLEKQWESEEPNGRTDKTIEK